MTRIVEDYVQHPTTKKWITQTYNLNIPLHMARYIARKRYAWPGGYELLAIMNDGGLVCSKCVHENYVEIAHDTKFKWDTGWRVVAMTTESELDGDNYCDHCNKQIN